MCNFSSDDLDMTTSICSKHGLLVETLHWTDFVNQKCLMESIHQATLKFHTCEGKLSSWGSFDLCVRVVFVNLNVVRRRQCCLNSRRRISFWDLYHPLTLNFSNRKISEFSLSGASRQHKNLAELKMSCLRHWSTSIRRRRINHFPSPGAWISRDEEFRACQTASPINKKLGVALLQRIGHWSKQPIQWDCTSSQSLIEQVG